MHKRSETYAFYSPQQSWGKVIFSEACVNNSVHGGVCVVAPRGHACLLWGGMRGCSGGHAWLLPGGHVWLLPGGLCMVAPGGMHGCLGGHVCLFLAPGGGVHSCSQVGMCGCTGGHVWLLPGGGACMDTLPFLATLPPAPGGT